MTKRILFLALVGVMTVGCGTDPDPSKNNANNQNNVNNTNNMNNMNNVNNMNNSNNMTNNNTNTVCGENPIYLGQIANTDDSHGGGVPAMAAFTADAGLQAVADELITFAQGQDDFDTNDVIEGALPFAAPLAVSGAVVTSTMFDEVGDRVFWIEDGNVALQVNLPDLAAYDFTVNVGDAISFMATEGLRDGNISITALTDFALDSAGNDVLLLDLTGQDVDLVNNVYRIVRIQGTITNGRACGSPTCWDFTHGTETITYRSSSTFDEEGDCITYVGPLGAFPGVFDDGGGAEPQVWARNFTWARGPFKN